ncbi:MAG: cyclic nucleotide-binding domain-containing protein [Deltaproteobacteria bacterium]
MGAGVVKAAGRAAGTTEGAWVEALRWCALAVFLAFPVFAFWAPHWAGRAFWTILLPIVPLLIVIAGYHRWRRICPLAWFANLPTRLGYPGERRASASFQEKYYYLVFSVFIASLWLRLVATNGNGRALALFLILLCLMALLFGTLFTGKTWCNYVCPVSFVEKIYTEPRGLRPTANSQCEKCTACKPACPDINEENGYWKEISLPSKQFIYFAFPGTVFAFYFYYYLQAGSWDYYFGGTWTRQPEVWRIAFLPGISAETVGFFFWPSVPRAAAAILTLVAGAFLSFGLFWLVEKYFTGRLHEGDEVMDTPGVRHVVFTIAAFTAFTIFYIFAGAPTLRLIPGAPRLMQILVVVTATLFLVRRLARRQRAYVEDTLARQIIRRWAWTDMRPPEDLHEAFLIHTIRSQSQATGYAQLLEVYKESVRESVASGFVSRGDVQRLESLRNQLQIRPGDHEKIMADLAEEERARITDPALQVSAEKLLQLDSYSRALQAYLERVSQGSTAPDDAFIRHLRQEYAVTPEEHGAVLNQLLGKGEGLAPHIAKAFEAIESIQHTIALVRATPTSAGSLLIATLRVRLGHSVGGLMRGFGFDPERQSNRALRDGLLSEDASARVEAVRKLGERVAQGVAARLVEAQQGAAREAAKCATLAEAVRWHFTSADPYVRVAALCLLDERTGVDEETLMTLVRDEHEVVCETAACLHLRATQMESREQTGLVTFERMIALHALPLFASLAPPDLLGLAQASLEKVFEPGQPLCTEGERGDEVFILISGDVEIFRWDGSEQRKVASEKAGGFIGEMAVLDDAPRSATVLAGSSGARALCLAGEAFRQVLDTNPSVVRSVIAVLAARIRGTPARGQAARESSSLEERS